MWNAILAAGGWVLFYLVILLWVRWVSLERAYFAGQDPEAWRPDMQPDDRALGITGAASHLGPSYAASVGRPT